VVEARGGGTQSSLCLQTNERDRGARAGGFAGLRPGLGQKCSKARVAGERAQKESFSADFGVFCGGGARKGFYPWHKG